VEEGKGRQGRREGESMESLGDVKADLEPLELPPSGLKRSSWNISLERTDLDSVPVIDVDGDRLRTLERGLVTPKSGLEMVVEDLECECLWPGWKVGNCTAVGGP
jgi:hypothetical protein